MTEFRWKQHKDFKCPRWIIGWFDWLIPLPFQGRLHYIVSSWAVHLPSPTKHCKYQKNKGQSVPANNVDYVIVNNAKCSVQRLFMLLATYPFDNTFGKETILETIPNSSILWDPTLVGEENETLFTRVWKHLSSRCVLKILKRSPKRKSSKKTISASGGLGLL